MFILGIKYAGFYANSAANTVFLVYIDNAVFIYAHSAVPLDISYSMDDRNSAGRKEFHESLIGSPVHKNSSAAWTDQPVMG